MDTDIKMRFSSDRLVARRAAEQRLAHAGIVAAEMLDSGRAAGSAPSSREIADAILRWLKTGNRG